MNSGAILHFITRIWNTLTWIKRKLLTFWYKRIKKNLSNEWNPFKDFQVTPHLLRAAINIYLAGTNRMSGGRPESTQGVLAVQCPGAPCPHAQANVTARATHQTPLPTAFASLQEKHHQLPRKQMPWFLHFSHRVGWITSWDIKLKIQFRGKTSKSDAYRSNECVCHSCKSRSKNSKQRLKIVKRKICHLPVYENSFSLSDLKLLFITSNFLLIFMIQKNGT